MLLLQDTDNNAALLNSIKENISEKIQTHIKENGIAPEDRPDAAAVVFNDCVIVFNDMEQEGDDESTYFIPSQPIRLKTTVPRSEDASESPSDNYALLALLKEEVARNPMGGKHNEVVGIYEDGILVVIISENGLSAWVSTPAIIYVETAIINKFDIKYVPSQLDAEFPFYYNSISKNEGEMRFFPPHNADGSVPTGPSEIQGDTARQLLDMLMRACSDDGGSIGLGMGMGIGESMKVPQTCMDKLLEQQATINYAVCGLECYERINHRRIKPGDAFILMHDDRYSVFQCSANYELNEVYRTDTPATTNMMNRPNGISRQQYIKNVIAASGLTMLQRGDLSLILTADDGVLVIGNGNNRPNPLIYAAPIIILEEEDEEEPESPFPFNFPPSGRGYGW